MKDKTVEHASNGFLAVLQRKETQVATLSEASDLLAEAVKAATSTGKKATVTLTLTVEPKQGALNFVTKLGSRLPQEEEPLCIFYADSKGNLHRDDPRQKELQLQSVDGGRANEETETPAAAAVSA